MIANKYKFYRSKRNKKLTRLLFSAASIWNHALSLQKRYYRLYGKYIGVNKMQKHIAKLRRNNPYWKELNSQSVQEICQRLDKAYQDFFKKIHKRPPKIKSKYKFKSFVYKQTGFKIIDNKLIINKVGTFKFRKSRDFYDIKNIRIKKDAVGDFWLIVTSSQGLKKSYQKTRKGALVGFDFGLKTYLTGSNGKDFESPLFYKEMQSEIKSKHRILSHKKRGSKNRTKARKDLARTYRKLDYKRSNFHWELAHYLCSNYDFIAFETLNIKAMQRLWGKKISDLSFSTFLPILKHVATKYGTHIHQIDKWYPSSKNCSVCGEKNEDLQLSDREWTCKKCGTLHDRDRNASKNILRQGCVEILSSGNSDSISSLCLKNMESHIL